MDAKKRRWTSTKSPAATPNGDPRKHRQHEHKAHHRDNLPRRQNGVKVTKHKAARRRQHWQVTGKENQPTSNLTGAYRLEMVIACCSRNKRTVTRRPSSSADTVSMYCAFIQCEKSMGSRLKENPETRVPTRRLVGENRRVPFQTQNVQTLILKLQANTLPLIITIHTIAIQSRNRDIRNFHQ